jgi:glycosyltransferase involved in cell wall biosynthesis
MKMDSQKLRKRILQIGNWPPPVCGWSMSLVGLRKELESRGWDCQVMNLNENRRVKSPEYIDVQSGWDYFQKVLHWVRRGYAVHVRVNGDTKKGYLLALSALLLARLWRLPALLTYCGGHQQNFFPAPKGSFRQAAFSLLFRVSSRIYCNSEAVKAAILTTEIPPEKVIPIPHFSTQYVQFDPAPLPAGVRDFCQKHDAVFFIYLCYRKEYMLEFLAEVMRKYRAAFPRVGFLLVGTSEREVPLLREFMDREQLTPAVCITGSVPHDLFLTMMKQSLAYIRMPLTDGVCSSVLEGLTMKVPVIASNNGTRPAGAELWKPGDSERLLSLLTEATVQHQQMVARIPAVAVDDNAGKLADDIEQVCVGQRSEPVSPAVAMRETSAADGR